MSVHFCGDYSQSTITNSGSFYMLFDKAVLIISTKTLLPLKATSHCLGTALISNTKQYKLATLQTAYYSLLITFSFKNGTTAFFMPFTFYNEMVSLLVFFSLEKKIGVRFIIPAL